MGFRGVYDRAGRGVHLFNRTVRNETMSPETFVRLDMPALGVGWNDGIEVLDLLRGELYSWAQHNFVRLTTLHPAHIFAVRPVT